MDEQAVETDSNERKPPFHWVDRYLKPVSRLTGWGREKAVTSFDNAYWILVLLSLLPALRAGFLNPFDWPAGFALNYSNAWMDPALQRLSLPESEIFRSGFIAVIALLIAMFLFLVAVMQRRYARLLVILPVVTLVLTYLATSLAVLQAQAVWLVATNALYAISSFAAFIYFIAAGRVGSVYFALFVLLLIAMEPLDQLIGWNHIIGFATASLVMRFVYEIGRQNRPLLRQLGRAGAVPLIGRSLSLWAPNLVLIFGGLWISHQLTSGTEELLYDQGVVTPFCIVHEAQGDAETLCPQEGFLLRDSEIRQTYRNDEPFCVYSKPRVELNRFNREFYDFSCPASFKPRYEAEVESAGDNQAQREEIIYRLSRKPFVESLELTIKNEIKIAKAKLEAAKSGIRNARISDPVWVGHEALELFGFVPHHTGLSQADCKTFDVDCAAANLVKRILNGAYADIRRRAEQRFVAAAVERAESLDSKVDDSLDAAVSRIGDRLDEIEQQTIQAIYGVYQTSKVVQFLLIAWLVIIGFKSFLYVFARVIFDKGTDIHVDLLEHEEKNREGTVRHLQEVMIPGDYPHTMYYKSNFQPLGPAPRFSIPQWRFSLLSRLRSGSWNMNRVDMPTDDHRGITFNAIEAEYLVDWEMEEGEEVIFNYGNFVAMNENIELRTVISLRVATMLMGRFIFHEARCKGGSGRLILRTRGKPATAEQVRQSIPASRLIAWNRYARFSVDSHLTRADIFLNGFNLRRSETADPDKPQGIIVVEADARSGSVMVGTLRFAKNFLLPV